MPCVHDMYVMYNMFVNVCAVCVYVVLCCVCACVSNVLYGMCVMYVCVYVCA